MVSNIFLGIGKNHTTIVTFLFKKISNFAKSEPKNHESIRKLTSKIIFFDTKNDHQCLVICDSINFKKEDKSTILSLIFLCKISKIWWKKSCNKAILNLIFLVFLLKNHHETSVNSIWLLFKNCYQITLLSCVVFAEKYSSISKKNHECMVIWFKCSFLFSNLKDYIVL